jgi:two-component system CheB/CheR fusion protein
MTTEKPFIKSHLSGTGEPHARLPRFPVVGIGASAGGIKAMQQLFKELPVDTGMAFVLIIHLSPDHPSRLAKVLQRCTAMPVTQVAERTSMQPDHVYVISAGNNLETKDGVLSVSPRLIDPSRQAPIDLFLKSLADSHGPLAIAMILSGSGSDGATGIGMIKARGGIVMVQELADAQYQEMPGNAIATGFADIVLPIARAGLKLVELRDACLRLMPALPAAPLSTEALSADDAHFPGQTLQALITLLRIRTGHDFQHYRRGTVLRRIARRLRVHSLPSLPAYQKFVESNPGEANELLKDMLIRVTGFFRDATAYSAIEPIIRESIFSRRAPDDPVRAWSVGCSSGQEAYSLAMLLIESRAAQARFPFIRVFATDIDNEAIASARTGCYPLSIATEIEPHRLRRFFLPPGDAYQVTKELREKVLFTTHNVLSDPPFRRLDLISCRNLLIYLDRTAQRQVLETLHLALRPGGLLFLGNSESADTMGGFYECIDKTHCIYRASKRDFRRPPSLVSDRRTGFSIDKMSKTDYRVSFDALRQRAFERYAPPSVTIDRDGDILHMSSKVGRFMQYVGEAPSQSLLMLVNPDLRLQVRKLIQHALTQAESATARAVRFMRGERDSIVDITARPIYDEESAQTVIVVFFDEQEMGPPDVPYTFNLPAHQAELIEMEADLFHAEKEIQASSERASIADQAVSASENELKAVNEEMSTSREQLAEGQEELLSVNEELMSVNAELSETVAEVVKSHDNLRNLIISTGIATVFVDSQMKIRFYTPAAAVIFNLIVSDIGRPLPDLRHRLAYPQISDDVQLALKLKQSEREITAESGMSYLARVSPYLTAGNDSDGAVITLVDITARRSAEVAAHSSEERLKLAALTTNDYAIIVEDRDGLIQSWNVGAQRVFGYDEKEVTGKSIDMIFVPEDRKNGVPLDERQRSTLHGRAVSERWYTRRDGVLIFCSGVTTPLDTDTFHGFAKIARDLTDKKSAESQQQATLSLERAIREQAEASIRLKDEFFAVLSHELKNPLNLIHVKAELLTRLPATQGLASVKDAADAIQRAVVGQAKIIDDLLDLSRVRTGKLAMNFGPVVVASVVESVVGASAADALANGIEVTMFGGDPDLVIEADPIRVEQMVWNLMRNALKFTPYGGRVKVTLSHVTGFVCIEVADTGQGIPPEFMPRIFEMFSQAEGGGKRDNGGLGIGLSLVRQLAELHGGRIEVESAGRSQGACFRLWLADTASASTAEDAPKPADTNVLRGLRILLVEDAVESLEAFRMLLELEGAIVSAQASAERALLVAQTHDFDIVLSDIGMPTMDGYEMVTQLRASSRTASLPAIALTGFGREQDVLKALKAGFNAHLSKPVSLDALTSTIERITKPV